MRKRTLFDRSEPIFSGKTAHRVWRPGVLTFVLALIVLGGAAAPMRASSSEFAIAPSQMRPALAEVPVLERMAFLAGGPIEHPAIVGEHLVVARGNALEAWHLASGEVRASLALPEIVRAITVEVGTKASPESQGRRIVALYGHRGIAVVTLSGEGELAWVARHEPESLELEEGDGTPYVSLDPGLALVDGSLYLPRRAAAAGYQEAILTVATLHADGSLTLVGETALARGEVWRMLWVDDHLYGLIGRTVRYAHVPSRLFVVDIAQRDRPRLLGEGVIDADGSPRELGWLSGMVLADTGRHLILADAGPLEGGGSGPDAPGALQVLDISDPRVPRMIGELRIVPRPGALATHGEQALVIGDRRTAPRAEGGPEPAILARVDLSRPEWPRLVDRTAIERSARGVVSDGRRAVVSTQGGDLGFYLLGEEPPRRERAAAGPGKVHQVEADGDLAVALYEASDDQREVAVLDVRDARRPRRLALVPDSGSVRTIALRGDVLLMVEREAGYSVLRVIDLSQPNAPLERGRIDGRELDPGWEIRSMAWRSDREVVLAGGEGLSVIDLSDLDRPRKARSLEHGADAGLLLDVEGDLALVGSNLGSSIQLVALDDGPDVRRHTITGLDSGGPIQLDLHEGQAWVSDNRDLRVFELQDEPLGHRPVAVYERLLEWGPAGTPIRRWGRYLLAVEWDRLRVLDTRVDGPPVEQQILGLPQQVFDVAIDGDRIYVAALDGGLHIFRAAEPETERPWRVALPWLGRE